jgi:LmbE family N-acetylglucosaminyl deacetylase
VTHVFVSPHPDDIALSCGGLVAGLRSRGEAVVIVTVFCGAGANPSLTDYQRDALGLGGEAATGTAPSSAAAMAGRRNEDELYARSVGAQIVFLKLPDAVFRGYEGEAQLMGMPRPDDPPPIEALARELGRLRPKHVYFPLGVGNHVDHQLTRAAGIALLVGARGGALVGAQGEPSSAGAGAVGAGLQGRLLFYEDFPYAVRIGFERLDQLPGDALATLPADVSLVPDYTELGALLERKVEGVRVYASQVDSLFGSDAAMEEAVRSRATLVGQLGGVGPAERLWRAVASGTGGP